MWVLLGTVFIGSLLGSMHCVGMCGPFAMLAGSTSLKSVDEEKSAKKRNGSMIRASAYSAGRLATYSVVGVVFGSMGMALNNGVAFSSWQQAATYVAGGLMIVVGMIALLRQFGVMIKLPSIAGRLQAFLQSHFQMITKQPPLRRAFLIGAFSCLMPCGWLYTFAIVAAGTGRPLAGALVMIVFWAGTVPIMIALMLGLNRLGASVQRQIPMAMATMVILIGVFTIAFRAPVVIGGDTNVTQKTEDLIEKVQNVDHSKLPCCCEQE